MAVLSNTGIRAGASGAAGADPYRVKRSARFNDDDSAYLNRTFATADSKKTWTISLWFKRSSGFGVEQGLFNSGVSGHPSTFLKIDTNNCLEYGDYQSGYLCQIVTNRKFRDPSAWYHLTIAVDTTQAVEANRFKLYINGVQETSFSTTNYYSLNDDTDWNNEEAHTLAIKSTDEFDGYLADIYFIDGTAKASTDFGESDADTGQWVPKKYSGSYGTNGFYLAMDPANAGTNYTKDGDTTNIGNNGWWKAFDGLTDGTWQNGAGASGATYAKWEPASPITVNSSLRLNTDNGSATAIKVNGSAKTTTDGWTTISGISSLSSIEISNDGSTWTYLCGVEVDGEVLVDHSSIGYDSSGNKNHWHENNLFGSEHTVANENFKAIGYVGTGSSGHAINVGFKPGLIWIKERGGSANHKWHDIIRGTDLQLQSNTTDPDETITNQVTSFDTNGFTLGDTPDANQSGEDFVAWCWNAGDTNVTNDASSTGIGTIDSTYRANTTGGFSIVSYTGTGSNGTVAHGLGKAPKFIIVKGRDSNGMAWSVYHDAIGHNGGNNYIELQSDSAAGSDDTAFQDTAPTSTVFSIGTKPPVNESGDNHIAYCWAETEGVSKFGSFAGSGSTLTFDCGFAPAYVLIKSHDTAGQEWVIHTKTLGTGELFAHAADAETNVRVVNFLPNGFSVNGGQGPVNYAGRNYIYIAFAGNPEGDLDLLADVPGAPYDNELNGGGNYATLNPLACSDGTPTKNGNLGMAASTGGHQVVAASMAVSSGKWWWEATIKALSPDYICFGMWDTSTELEPTLPGYANTDSWSVQQNTGKIYWSGHYNSTTISTYAAGDDIAIAYDNGSCYVYKNGVIENSGNPVVTGLTGDWAPIFHGVTSTWEWENINFGQRPFKYTPRTDHKGLNTYNISEPTVAKGNSGFDVKIYTGDDDVDRSFTGYNMSPDLIWTKDRSDTYHNILCDSVRGSAKKLSSNLDDEENDSTTLNTSYGYVDTFDTNGYTLGGGTAQVNKNSNTYVSWAWDAGTANTISSTVNAADTWSDRLSLTGASAWNADPYGKDACFNGIIGSGTAGYGQSQGGTNPNSITFTPASGLAYSSKVEVYIINNANEVSVNGGTLQSISQDAWVTVASGSGTLTSLKFERASTSGASFSGIRIDGKELVDTAAAKSAYVGELNSSLYDTSEDWSASFANGAGNTTDTGQAFRGITDATGTGLGSTFLSLTDVAFDVTSTISVWVHDAGSNSVSIEYNGTTYTNSSPTKFGWTDFTVPSGSNSGTLKAKLSSSSDEIRGVKIDGKILVDSNVTPPNMPSIESEYRVNTDTGFSIVKYNSGSSSGNHTVAHGINAAPNFIIHKRIDGTGNWWVYHSSVITDMKDYLQLNSDAAKATNSAEMWGGAAPTSTVFGTRVGDLIGTSQDAITYCWSEVAGYSKFGSYTGNGSTDGPFVWCGFRPRWVCIKNTAYSGHSWVIYDTERDTYNLTENYLQADDSAVEATDIDIDILSNGFKPRIAGGTTAGNHVNYSTGAYVFAAFAESPFKYANAR